MKLSLAWIFDHIEADWKDQDVDFIAAKFNEIVAEIEHVTRFKVDSSQLYLARQEGVSDEAVTLFIPELSQKITLPVRSATYDLIAPSNKNPIFMLKREGSLFSWASLVDLGVEKDGLLPAFDVDEYALQGKWRTFFETEDVIFEVDNKSLTHRPDMWGHRGFAREIAAYLDLPFLCDDEFLKKQHVLYVPHSSPVTATTPISIEIQADKACSRFAGLYIKSVENKPSNLLVASRLLRIGARPINALVDLTNYIANDWTQPLHVYDARNIDGKRVIVRMAHVGEKLEMLDGQLLELNQDDLVIADAKKPMCLAGVMGGKHDSLNAQTTELFVEAANFDAATVRRAALRHKLRTDSSARFEKTLDPNLAVDAIRRFLKLLEEGNIAAQVADDIVAVGLPPAQEQVIEVSHKFLEKRIGVTLSEDDVIKPLSKRGFKILESYLTGTDDIKERVYLVCVPTYRGSKDIKIKEDILEEVVRCYGFAKIPHVLPPIIRTPYETQHMMRERKIKHFLAHAAHMTEMQNYAFFDEENLATLGLLDLQALAVLNPVSENYYRLITSLIPGLLKNIRENQTHREDLSFFEWGKIWPYHQNKVQEQYNLAGIFFERKKAVDFYSCKAELQGLFRFLDLDEKKLTWKKVKHVPAPWYLATQTAQLMYEGQELGYAGTLDRSFFSKIDALPESSAFIFELQGQLLLDLASAHKRYIPISRFQDTYFDVSLMTPLSLTVAQIQERFAQASRLIQKVELLDFFEKKEWAEQRSLTFRLWLSHPDKTLEKNEIDAVWENIVGMATDLGATLRSQENA